MENYTGPGMPRAGSRLLVQLQPLRERNGCLQLQP